MQLNSQRDATVNLEYYAEVGISRGFRSSLIAYKLDGHTY